MVTGNTKPYGLMIQNYFGARPALLIALMMHHDFCHAVVFHGHFSSNG
jgi:hypothetical protein